MATTVVGDLILRAGLELAGLQRDLGRMQTMLQDVQRQASGASLQIDMVPANAQAQGQDIARELAQGIERDRKRITDSVTSGVQAAVTQTAEAAAGAMQQAAGSVQLSLIDTLGTTEGLPLFDRVTEGARAASAEVQALADAMQQSTSGTSSAATAIDAVTEANARASVAMRERSDVEQGVGSATRAAADGYREWANAARAAGGSIAEVAADVDAVTTAFVRGDASVDDYAAAIEHARRQVDAMGVSGGSGIAGEIARAEVALAQGKEAAEAYARSIRQALSPETGAAGAAGMAGAANVAAGALGNMNANMTRSVSGAGRLNIALTSLLRQVTGASPVFAQMTNVIGSFALGSGVMVAVLAGLAALAVGWNRVTRRVKEARQEQETTLERLREFAKQRALPEGGQLEVDRNEAERTLQSIRRQITLLEESRDAMRSAGTGAPTGIGQIERMLAQRRKELTEWEQMERQATQGLVEASQERDRRLRSQEVSALASLIAMGAATEAEYQRAQEMVREESDRLREIRDEQAARLSAEPVMVFFNPMGASGQAAADLFGSASAGRAADEAVRLSDEAADAAGNAERLRAALAGVGTTVESAAEKAARALREEIGHLARARDMGLLRAGDIERAVTLEQRLSEELRTGNRTLSERVRLGEQVAQLSAFSLSRAADAGITVPHASVLIGGVEITNPEEMARQYAEQAKATLERERIEVTMYLRPIVVAETDTQRDQRESNRRRAAQQAAMEATQAFNESVQAGLEVTRAFGDLADAADALGESVGGALRAIETMAEGAMRVRFGQELGGALGGLSQVSGYMSIAAGIVQGVNALFGESEAQRQYAAAVQQATDALERFRRELSGFRPDTADARREVVVAIGRIENPEALARAVGWRDIPGGMGLQERRGEADQRRVLDEYLRQAGTTLDRVTAVADSMGIALFDDAGRFVVENFLAIADAAGLAARAMVGFGERVLADRQQERSLQDRVLGIDRTPEQQASALFGDLAAIAPRLFAEFLSGVDLTDVAAARQALFRMLEGFAEGGEWFAEMMGGFTRDEFLDWLGQSADSLKAMDEVTRSVTGALLAVPQGFRILNLELERFNAAQRRQVEDMSPPSSPPPAAEPPGGRPERPETRPPDDGGDGTGRERPRPTFHYTDNRTVTFEVSARDDESPEEVARRIEEIVRRMDRETAMAFGDAVYSGGRR